MPRFVELVCAHCGKDFTFKVNWRGRLIPRFCSRKCRDEVKVETIEVRFKKYLTPPNEHGCILWSGPTTTSGYGYLEETRVNGAGHGKRPHAHRLSWEYAHGASPGDLEVMHDCDQFYPHGDITYRRCVNHEHLLLGTHQENMADMAVKGRNLNNRGERNHWAKLTLTQVRAIRIQYASGQWTLRQLAEEHGTSTPNVHSIVKGRSWKHSL
jgi:hypothetical protein